MGDHGVNVGLQHPAQLRRREVAVVEPPRVLGVPAQVVAPHRLVCLGCRGEDGIAVLESVCPPHKDRREIPGKERGGWVDEDRRWIEMGGIDITSQVMGQ